CARGGPTYGSSPWFAYW
nr:immunoglobulin heavy chain junction region [Mus musculus]